MKYLPICVVLLVFSSCFGQQTVQQESNPRNENELLGGPFENRDVFYEGMPKSINSIDTSSVWEGDEKSLVLSGRILDRSGKKAIPNVVLYYYHTDANGHYSGGGIHGAIRGWVKSDEDGRYTIYTARPAPYPNRFELAHIHLTVLEENLKVPYYIDDIVFDDDRGLTSEKRRALNNRAGSGIVRIRREGGIAYAERDIILGLNIPNHPANEDLPQVSGPEVGEDLFSFNPLHLYGPDAGTRICPICKFGRYLGIAVMLNVDELTRESLLFLLKLDEVAESYQEDLRIFVYIDQNSDEIMGFLKEQQIKNISMALLAEDEAEKNGLPFPLEDSILLYKYSRVIARIDDFRSKDHVSDILNDELVQYLGY